jgi:DNA replication protein DnaC
LYEAELADVFRTMMLSRNLADMAQQIDADTQQEYMLKLLKKEQQNRAEVRSAALVKSAGFYSMKSPDGFITDDIQFPAETGMDELMALRFIGEKRNVIMYGGTGTGKTMLSTILGVEACRNGIPVKFFRTAAIVNQLSEAKAAGTLSKLAAKVGKADLLIFDEFGYVPVDRTGAQLLFEIISECYEKKPIILNTNLEFSSWVNILYDRNMTAALIARLVHYCHLLVFTGQDMRLKQSSINDVNRAGGNATAAVAK